MASTIPIGFENIGNTCFANAVLQCLLHTPEMLMFLSSLEKENCFDQCNKKISKIFQKPAINRLPNKIEESKSYFEDENTNFRAHRGCKLISSRSTYPEYCCAYCGVKNIAEEINNSNKICVPHGLRDILKKTFGDHIKFGLQQDAHEFLIMLLHNMQSSNCAKDKLTTHRHNDDFEMNFNKMTLNIKLSDIFEGSFNSSVTCLKCNYSTKIKQDFLDISLDVKSSFEESMKDFFSDCKFEGNNQYDCHNCRKHTNAIKKITLEKEPHNLIINIKKYDKFGLKIKSSDAAVTNFKYVQKFNLNDYISHSLQKSHSTKKDSIYELYGVINHEGKHSNCGHYTCFVKGYDKNWYLCDDAKIKRIYDISDFSKSKAYILFYKLIDGPSFPSYVDRKISSVSTEDLESEVQHNLLNKYKPLNKINLQRSKILKPSKLKANKNCTNVKRRVKKMVMKEEENQKDKK